MEKIVLASNNKKKIEEIRMIFKDKEILSLNDIGYYEEIIEDGETFLDNSLIKAKAVSEYLKSKELGYDVIADDSGLCCPALNGAPGVYSARYAGEHDDAANRKKLIQELKDKKDKSAYFVCVIVIYHSNGEYKYYEGKCFGNIIDEERGRTDFGYDPIFLSDDLGITFGEAPLTEKNKVSHRGRALHKLQEDIN